MSTAEDVFYLYERNSLYYCDCKDDREKKENCYCKKTVFPLTIGDQRMPCNINLKCYIKPEEICPICYDPILTKCNALLTWCGHSFHKKCLFNYVKVKWSTNYVLPLRCPMCRSFIGHPTFAQRYRFSYFNICHKYDNGLDKLEDFWLSQEYLLPAFCSNGYNHYLGFDKNCICCKAYREKGELLYINDL